MLYSMGDHIARSHNNVMSNSGHLPRPRRMQTPSRVTLGACAALPIRSRLLRARSARPQCGRPQECTYTLLKKAHAENNGKRLRGMHGGRNSTLPRDILRVVVHINPQTGNG